MSSLQWIDLEFAITVNQKLEQYKAATGLRDQGLLESALARPEQRHYYEENADIADLAATYAHGIAKNHPFIDGNKRTAWVVCEVFLKRNGIELTADDESAEKAILSLASGEWTEADFADWIRANSTNL